jgi:type IV pilus assembly protein PilF
MQVNFSLEPSGGLWGEKPAQRRKLRRSYRTLWEEYSVMKIREGILLLIAGSFLLSGCGPTQQDLRKASAHHGLGYNYLQQGDPTSALREFLEAERLNPQDAQIQYALGLALNAKGRYLEALEHYKRALSLDPKYSEAHNAMGATYLEIGQWDEAIHEFNLVLQDILYLTPFYVLNNLGWAYYKKGDLPRAIEYYRRALGMKPDFGLAYYNSGLAYRDQKQEDQAIAAFQKAADLAPGLLDAHFQLGKLYFETGKTQQAQKSFEEVVRLSPRSESALMARQYLDLLKKSSK